jgi:type IV secretory pathway component VirB8
MIISLMVVENDVVTTCFFVFFVILLQNLLHIFDLLPFKKFQPYFIVVTNW